MVLLLWLYFVKSNLRWLENWGEHQTPLMQNKPTYTLRLHRGRLKVILLHWYLVYLKTSTKSSNLNVTPQTMWRWYLPRHVSALCCFFPLDETWRYIQQARRPWFMTCLTFNFLTGIAFWQYMSFTMKPGPAVRQRCSPLNLLNHLSGTVTACEPIQHHSITERIVSAREDTTLSV